MKAPWGLLINDGRLMLHNNMVYKGYRLTAAVSRISVGGSSRPAFTATVAVELAGDQDRLGEPYVMPLFASGGFVSVSYTHLTLPTKRIV